MRGATHGAALLLLAAASDVRAQADVHDSITCPVVGTFVKSGLLVPDADGLITRQQTFDAFVAAGVPVDIATATTNGNFLSAECPVCPEAINPFEMDVVPSGTAATSPPNGPQEHFRSTGIRDNGVAGGLFDFAAGVCGASGVDGVWTTARAECFTHIWDRDNGCFSSPIEPPSHDVSEDKRPAGCGACESRQDNAACHSALFDTIMFMFNAFKTPAGTITNDDFRAMWVDLEFPTGFPMNTANVTVAAAAVEDTYVQKNLAGESFGSDVHLKVRNPATQAPNVERIAYLKFNFEASTAVLGVKQAVLKLTGAGHMSHVIVNAVPSIWTDAIAWNSRNRPVAFAEIDGPRTVGAGQQRAFDVTSAVTGAGVVSFALTRSEQDGWGALHSMDAADVSVRPVLEVTFETLLPDGVLGQENLTVFEPTFEPAAGGN